MEEMKRKWTLYTDEDKEFREIDFCDFNCYKRTDFLLAHHFDFRGLIEKGLAIEVTEENNPYKDIKAL